MTTTYQEYFEFISAAINFKNVHSEESKFKYALEKVARLNKEVQNDYAELVEDMRIEYCEKNDKGHILTDERGNKLWSADGTRKFNAAVKGVSKKEIEVKTWAYDLSQDEFESEDDKEIFAKFLVADENFKVQ